MMTKHDLSSLLFYPFEKNVIEPIEADKKILLCGSVPTREIESHQNIDALQNFKPEADLWYAQGLDVLHNLGGDEKYSAVFAVLPQQKQATLSLIAQSVSVLEDKGLLVCVAANDAGGKQIVSNFKKFGLSPHSLSKNKCRIVWALKENINIDFVEQCILGGAIQQITLQDYSFTTQAGIYGWNKIDKGSQLLIDTISIMVTKNLKGIGADFGCGYGFLSSQILMQHPDIKTLHALEADYDALQCTKDNLKNHDNVKYDWVDLTKPCGLKNLNWIVMNPPFHEGKKASSEIGQNFIEIAHKALSSNGVLYMVANAHLPYEKTLSHLFSRVEKIIEQDGYKVLFAQK